MNHFRKIAERLEEQGLDAMMLTGAANRFYASGFYTPGTDAVALVTRDKAWFFTDSRYTEAAERHLADAILGAVGGGRGYSALIKEVVSAEKIQRMGFEEAYMTMWEYEHYRKALSCELVSAAQLLWDLRMVKDDWELETMIAA